jgi:hypothetical protein
MFLEVNYHPVMGTARFLLKLASLKARAGLAGKRTGHPGTDNPCIFEIPHVL